MEVCLLLDSKLYINYVQLCSLEDKSCDSCGATSSFFCDTCGELCSNCQPICNHEQVCINKCQNGKSRNILYLTCSRFVMKKVRSSRGHAEM